jgi:streptogramin lyase
MPMISFALDSRTRRIALFLQIALSTSFLVACNNQTGCGNVGLGAATGPTSLTFPNVQVSDGSTNYTEAAAVQDPNNEQTMWVGVNALDKSTQVAFSGNTQSGCWQPLGPALPDHGHWPGLVDPSLAYDAKGNLYYSFVAGDKPIGTDTNTFMSTQVMVSQLPKNPGTATNPWMPPVVVDSRTMSPSDRHAPDKPLMTVDLTHGQFSHFNRIYIAYDLGDWDSADSTGTKDGPLIVAWSDDGKSWSQPMPSALPGNSRGVVYPGTGGESGAFPEVDRNGRLWVAWKHKTSGTPGIYVVDSKTGGDTFESPTLVSASTTSTPAYQLVHTGGNPQYGFPSLGIDRRADGRPQFGQPGRLYVVWSDEWAPTGNTAKMHVFSSHSDDGSHWSAAKQIDVGNPNDAWQPAIAVDNQTGVVAISWYDRRLDQANQRYNLYYTQSSDGGQTFVPPIRVSNDDSDPSGKAGTGDYGWITAASGWAHPVWVSRPEPDKDAQIFTAPINEALVTAKTLVASPSATASKRPSTSVTPTVTKFAVPSGAYSWPIGITVGPDGAIWFTENGAFKIGRITTGGVFSEYPTTSRGPVTGPEFIAAGPDGNLWFTMYGVDQIGRITTAGVITEYEVPTAGSYPWGITAGPDGNLWFTEHGGMGNQIGRITPAGVIREYRIPTADSGPDVIAAGPDGNLWFTEDAGRIGRITTGGVISEYPIPTANSGPIGIAAGPDGNLWFTESKGDQIARITPAAGVISEYPIPAANSQPLGIAVGPDGNLWFTESGANQIGRITTAGVITELPIPTVGSYAEFIVEGPDGKLWFTEYNAGQIGRVG